MGHVVRMEEMKGAYRDLAGKPEGKRPLGRSRSRWEDNFKVDDLLHLSVLYMPLCMLACVMFCAMNKWYIYIYTHTHTHKCNNICVCVFTYGGEETCIQGFGGET